MYEIYDEIVKLQRFITSNEQKFTEKQLKEIRTAVNRARSIAGEAKA